MGDVIKLRKVNKKENQSNKDTYLHESQLSEEIELAIDRIFHFYTGRTGRNKQSKIMTKSEGVTLAGQYSAH